MATPVVTHCNACHGSHEVMEASFQLGKSLPPDTFDYRPAKGRVIFKTPRPVRGHTQVFTNFADHPEFLLHTAQLRETIALRFNHQRHFVADIPPVNGKKLQCADCHQPGPNGVYPLKVSYAAHCQTCHALQFDEHNPDLLLPHGPPQAVHAFLHSLETQYADHARRKGITGLREQEDFVTQQMLRLRAQTLSGENLERQVFFNDKRSGPAVSGLAPERATGRAKFPGCAFCHEVTSAGDLPLIAPVTQPDRWLIRARFNHAKHTSASCVECHDALSSRDTADILMPHKAKCAECHSLPGHGPRSGVRDDCSLCHAYHADR